MSGVNPFTGSRLFCAVLLLACAPPAARPRAPAPRLVSLERDVARRINAHRAARRLKALVYDTAVAAIARAHSQDMADQRVPMGHDGFKHRADLVNEGLPFDAIAENVALNDYAPSRTVAVAVTGWLRSPHHLENIEGDYDVTGVGIVRASDSTFYYTQLFVARRR